MASVKQFLGPLKFDLLGDENISILIALDVVRNKGFNQLIILEVLVNSTYVQLNVVSTRLRLGFTTTIRAVSILAT